MGSGKQAKVTEPLAKKLPITINAFIKIGNAAGGGGKVSTGMIITDPPPHPTTDIYIFVH